MLLQAMLGIVPDALNRKLYINPDLHGGDTALVVKRDLTQSAAASLPSDYR
jgi:hypothetical protein